MLCLYYSYIHSYLNYADPAWCSTRITSLKSLQSQQKYLIELFFTKLNLHIHENISKKIIYWISINRIFSITFFFYKKTKTKRQPMFFFLNSEGLRIITQSVSLKNIILHLPLHLLTKSKRRKTIRAPKLWSIILNIK